MRARAIDSAVLREIMIRQVANDVAAPRAYLRLSVLSQQESHNIVLSPGGEVLIGRTAECQVALADTSVSRRHAKLRAGATLQVEDLGSYNGTFVRGRRLAAGQAVELALGEPFEIGAVVCVVHHTGAYADW